MSISWSELVQYLPLLIPLFLIQISLIIAALVNLRKQERVRGSRLMWVFVILFINMIGPIIYFLAGREEE